MVDLDDIADLDVDESKLALLSGIGFVLLIVYFIFVMWPLEGFLLYSVLLMIFSISFPFLFYLDEMSFAPMSLGEYGSKFLAGIMFMLMVVVLALTFKHHPDHWPEAVGEILIAIPSVSFLIHSVLA